MKRGPAADHCPAFHAPDVQDIDTPARQPDANRRRLLAGGAVLAATMLLAACQPTVLHHGYLPRKGDLEQLREGMSKTEVEALLGSPSTTATIDSVNDSYYYISSTTRQTAFLRPQEVDRRVLAIRFDRNGLVKSFALYGLEDGQVVNINDRETPAAGKELGILQSLFSRYM